MKLQTSINRIKRDFFFYAFLVLLLTVWNILNKSGAAENPSVASQLIRGGIRIAILLYLTFQISSIRKGIWWISVVVAALLGGAAVIAAVLGVVVGSVYSSDSTNMPLYLTQLLVPAAFMLDALYVLMKKEVREAFFQS